MAKRNHYGLILAGGRGTRFWPRSRRQTPKQLLPFIGAQSLLQETLDRLRPLIPAERIWVLTSEQLRRQVIRQLPEVPPRQVIAEPVSRNTAPCLGLAAQILSQMDKDAVLGVFPADHLISNASLYRRYVRAALKGAEKGHLMVMGIEPRWPDTGYGYLEFPAGLEPGGFDPVKVMQFREKPKARRAQRYVDAGNFYWNSGMFFWRADVFVETLRRYLPGTSELLASLPAFGSRKFKRALGEVFPQTESISVDYAVMEKSDNVMGLAAAGIGWNDLGSWNAIYKLLDGGKGGNITRTDALFVASGKNYVEAPGKLVAMLGVENLVVVDTPDAILVADRNRAQQVGDIVRLLEKLKRDDLL